MQQINAWIFTSIVAPVVVFITERILGWRTVSEHEVPRKFLLLTEPHTSNYDLLVVFYWSCKIRRRIYYVIKEETRQWFLVGRFLQWTGAIFIDREKPMTALKRILRAARAHEDFILLVAPSGTRAYTPGWKPGFHFIARKAKMPFVPAGADFPTKQVHIGAPVMPTKDIEADIAQMRPMLEKITARHPEKASPIQLQPVESETAPLV